MRLLIFQSCVMCALIAANIHWKIFSKSHVVGLVVLGCAFGATHAANAFLDWVKSPRVEQRGQSGLRG